jgi:hypothetical protein
MLKNILKAAMSLLFLLLVQESSWALTLRDNSCAGFLRPSVVLTQDGIRPVSEVTSLRLLTLNFDSIYEYRKPEKRIFGVSGYTYVVDEDQPPRLKPIAHVKRLAAVINKSRPDIFLGVEIESFEAAQRFAQEELGGQYVAIFFPGLQENVPRMAYFLRKDLPFIAEFESHRDTKAYYVTKREHVDIFPRDVPQLNLYRANETKPFLQLFGMHAKSRRSSATNKNDHESSYFRTTQFIAFANLLKNEVLAKNPRANVVLMGDFNTDIQGSREIIPINSVLASSILRSGQIPRNNSFTQTYIDGSGHVHYRQLDDIFVSPHLIGSILQTHVLDIEDENSVPYPRVTTRAQRDQLPTDHRPVFMELQIPK